MKTRSFRIVLLVIFLSFSAISLLTFSVSKVYISKKTEVQKFKLNLQEIQTLIYQDFKVQSDFYFNERSNPDFYKTKSSKYLDNHISNHETIRHALIGLLGSSSAKAYNADTILLGIIDELVIYSSKFKSIVDIQFSKGFKDFGTIGKMRGYVHDMERCKEFELSDVLMLRRHEKDYLLRNDLKYSEKLHRMANSVVMKLERRNDIQPGRKDSLRLLLNNYTICFDKVVRYDNEQGLITNTGLKAELDNAQIKIISDMRLLIAKSAEIEHKQLVVLNAISMTLIALIATASIILSIWLSKRVTRKITTLSCGMRDFVNSGFDKIEDNISPSTQNDEIGQLTNNYIVMREKIVELVHSFKKKVEERTAEIRYQKEQLEIQSEEILAQRDRLSEQNQFIDKQKQIVEKQNHEIFDSFKYAAGIQQTMMPDTVALKTILPEIQIFYKPLDVISGDYYWAHKIHRTEDTPEYSFFAIADCTGHGVPGAMMSMLGISFLNEIIIGKGITEVHTVLSLLRENVINALRYRNTKYKSYDGMDIALGAINHDERRLYFAGGNRDAQIIRNKELIVLEGDKMPIGRPMGKMEPFGKKEIELEAEDIIYLFSDGYTDQFGGPNNKKYTKRRFKEKLKDLCTNHPFDQHAALLEQEFKTWQGKQAQIDDISVMGIRWTKELHCQTKIHHEPVAVNINESW